MPLFMDRHDIPGGMPDDVAEAHRRDVWVQDRYGVKFLTYWFDERRGMAFCLVDAPDKEAVHCVHREAHGLIPADIVEVPLSAVEAFLGRIQDPEPPPGASQGEIDSGHRAIMFTDIVGSTGMTERLGDRHTTELVRAHDSMVRRCLHQFDGREVKHTGDGIMAAFAAARSAVDCACAVLKEFEYYNIGNAEPIQIRLGLDCGEPVEDSNDLFGSTVQRAARLCAAAGRGRILVSDNIYREDGREAIFSAPKARRLKGFTEPVNSFECRWSEVA